MGSWGDQWDPPGLLYVSGRIRGAVRHGISEKGVPGAPWAHLETIGRIPEASS